MPNVIVPESVIIKMERPRKESRAVDLYCSPFIRGVDYFVIIPKIAVFLQQMTSRSRLYLM